MKKITSHIPNFITSLNLLCGCFAVVFAFQGIDYLAVSAVLIVLGSVFDFFDGTAARVLKAYSAIGKDLDSLADLISFGFAPSVILYQLMQHALFGGAFSFASQATVIQYVLLFSPFLITVFSALRLAKFNNDSRQTESFIGLTTTANGINVSALALLFHFHSEDEFVKGLLLNTWFVVFYVVLFSFLLVSELPMFSLKFKSLAFGKNKIRFLFLAISLLLIATLQWFGLVLVIPTFIVLSVIIWLAGFKSETSK